MLYDIIPSSLNFENSIKDCAFAHNHKDDNKQIPNIFAILFPNLIFVINFAFSIRICSNHFDYLVITIFFVSTSCPFTMRE